MKSHLIALRGFWPLFRRKIIRENFWRFLDSLVISGFLPSSTSCPAGLPLGFSWHWTPHMALWTCSAVSSTWDSSSWHPFLKCLPLSTQVRPTLLWGWGIVSSTKPSPIQESLYFCSIKHRIGYSVWTQSILVEWKATKIGTKKVKKKKKIRTSEKYSLRASGKKKIWEL